MNTKHPLELNIWKGDHCIVGCKGHHPIEAFEKALNDDLTFKDWPHSKPVHEWLKAVPHGEGGNIYVNVKEGVKGAFPATVAYEKHDCQHSELEMLTEKQGATIAANCSAKIFMKRN